MSQAAAAAAQGDPESSSCFLCIEGDDPDKRPPLGKGLGALLPSVQSSRTLGVDKDICRTRCSWPHFIPAGLGPQHCFFGCKSLCCQIVAT